MLFEIPVICASSRVSTNSFGTMTIPRRNYPVAPGTVIQINAISYSRYGQITQAEWVIFTPRCSHGTHRFRPLPQLSSRLVVNLSEATDHERFPQECQPRTSSGLRWISPVNRTKNQDQIAR